MYYYLVCRFLREENLSPKPYVYSVIKEDYDKAKIGYWYKIMNSDGYNYRNSNVEITGKYSTDKKQMVNGSRLVDEDVFSFNYIAIKKLVKLYYVGKNQKADILEPRLRPNSSLSIENPIVFNGSCYSSVGDISNGLTINPNGITFTISSSEITDFGKELFGIKEDKKEKKTISDGKLY